MAVRPEFLPLPAPDRTPILRGSAAEPGDPQCRCRACRTGDRATTTTELRFGAVRLTADGLQLDDGPPRTLRPGDTLEHRGVRVLALPSAGPIPVLVAGSGPHTVLWATGSGPLPEATLDAVAGAGLTVAALDVRGTGPAPDPVPGEGLAHTLARLRRVGALAPGCDVVGIGVPAHTVSTELGLRLSWWGARLAPDGGPLGPDHHDGLVPAAERTLLLGPASSGKSALAELLLAADPDVDYLPAGPAPDAAGQPPDPDWAARIRAHRERRPAWWRTVDGGDLAEALARPGPALLVDSLGTWVTAALDRCGAWHDAPAWQDRFEAEVASVVTAWRRTTRRVVAVGEETGWGVIPSSSAGRRFREALGGLTRRLAADSEQVRLVVAGRVLELDPVSRG